MVDKATESLRKLHEEMVSGTIFSENLASSTRIDYHPGMQLPKWPWVEVIGKSVSVDQASEIIRRTDTFVNLPIDKWVEFHVEGANILGMPFAHPTVNLWRESWGTVPSYHMAQNWIAGAIDPRNRLGIGWCHPDGVIEWSGTCCEKWPIDDGIMSELEGIAEAFPFLNMVVRVFADGVIEYSLKDGAVNRRYTYGETDMVQSLATKKLPPEWLAEWRRGR